MDYFEHHAISNSKLGWYKQSPAHYKYFMEHGKEDRPAYLIGSASHTVLFEADKFDKRYHKLDESLRPFPNEDYRNHDNRRWKKEITEAYTHKTIITVKDYDTIKYMMEALQQNDQVKELLSDCLFEEEVYWTDEITGLECKKKLDISSKSNLFRADYKTADSADPYKWQKKAWTMDYYRQAGFYGLDDNIESPIPFWFIVQEKSAPYGVSIHKCTQDMVNYGKDESRKLLGQINECMKANYWPGYEIKTPVDKKQEYFDFDIPGWVLQHQ